MEVQYDSQIHAIGQKAQERNLDLQEVSDYYHTCHAAAQRSCSHPEVPPIYHQFLAERETWTYYFEEEFPGKDPLYDCFVAALSQSETNHTRRIEQLEVALQRADLIIHSKDDLLSIKEETLLANKALMSGKDDIIKIRESEIRTEIGLVKAHENTIAWQNRDIQERNTTIKQLKKNLQELNHTGTPRDVQKLQNTLENRTKEIKNTQNTIRKRNDAIKSLTARLQKYEASASNKQGRNKVKKEVKRENNTHIKHESMEY